MHVITLNILMYFFPGFFYPVRIFKLLLSIHIVFFLFWGVVISLTSLMDTDYPGKWIYNNSVNVSVDVGHLG